MKTCFVMMGFGTKNGVNLDMTYNQIILPCIIEKRLIPVPFCEGDHSLNGYRSDQISGNTLIDFEFIHCLRNADIAIVDISTMNNNAIYELGARHALKGFSTILLCSNNAKKEFRFFDIDHLPIVFFNHNGQNLSEEEILKTKAELNKRLEYAISDTRGIPDSPIFITQEIENAHPKERTNTTLYQKYLSAKEDIDNERYDQAAETCKTLFDADASLDNLCLYSLAMYKKAFTEKNLQALRSICSFLMENKNNYASLNAEYYGRLGAIYARIFEITKSIYDLNNSILYYQKGAFYDDNSLYCQRNHCASLLKAFRAGVEKEMVTTFFYTSLFFAQQYLESRKTAETLSGEMLTYRVFNENELRSIIKGKYLDYYEMRETLRRGLKPRQLSTIMAGSRELKTNLEKTIQIVSG